MIDTLDMHRYELVAEIERLSDENSALKKKQKIVARACNEYSAGNYEEAANLMMAASPDQQRQNHE